MSTEVTYHHEQGRTGPLPAVNVKVHTAGVNYWPDGLADAIGEDRAAAIVGRAYDEIAAEFWTAAANIARGLGLGEIEQEGRSGGWLVITSGMPDYVSATRSDVGKWLAAYSKLAAWVGAYLGNAPEMVRKRARSMAIDEIGASAAERMFQPSILGGRTLSESIPFWDDWLPTSGRTAEEGKR